MFSFKCRVRKLWKENSCFILNYYPVIPSYAERMKGNDGKPQLE
jgi:hypothetical protein